jgi:hypothetical protein
MTIIYPQKSQKTQKIKKGMHRDDVEELLPPHPGAYVQDKQIDDNNKIHLFT